MVNVEFEKKGLEAERLLIEGLEDLGCSLDYNGSLDKQSKLDFVVYQWNEIPSYQNMSMGVQFTTYVHNEEKFTGFVRHIERRRPAVDIIVYLEVASDIGRDFALPELVYGILMGIAFNANLRPGDNFRVTVGDDWRFVIRTFDEILKVDGVNGTETERNHSAQSSFLEEKYPKWGTRTEGIVIDVDPVLRRCYVEDSERRRYFLIARECGAGVWTQIITSSEPLKVKFTVAPPIDSRGAHKPRATLVTLADV